MGERNDLVSWRAALAWLLRRSIFPPLLCVFCLMILIVPPAGDFPLNDDWIYARMAKNLLEHHALEGHPVSQAFALGSTLWGAGFAWLFGFSHVVLRVSTLALALITTWAAARAVLEFGAPRGMALLAGLAILCNPIFLNLSYTFMTDVPMATAATLAAWCYIRALNRGRVRDVALGSLLISVGFTIRQFALLGAFAYAGAEIILWWRGKRTLGSRHAAAFFSPLAAGAALYVFHTHSALTFWPPEAVSQTALGLVRDSVWLFAVCLQYMGLFALPLALGRAVQLLRRPGTWNSTQWLAFSWFFIGIFLLSGHFEGSKGFFVWPMPNLGNILFDLGTGPRTLRNPDMPGSVAWDGPSAGVWWWPITFLSMGAAALLLTEFLRMLFRPRPAEESRSFGPLLFLGLCAGVVLLIPYQCLVYFTFDRYLLPAVCGHPGRAGTEFGAGSGQSHRGLGGRGAQSRLLDGERPRLSRLEPCPLGGHHVLAHGETGGA